MDFCCISALKILSLPPCERNTRVSPYRVIIESVAKMSLVFQNPLSASCCPVPVPLNPHGLPNLCPLNPDYQRHSQTLGNKITSLLPSWATLFQINYSKLILPPKCTHNLSRKRTARRCTCAQSRCLGWRAARSSVILVFVPTHLFNISYNPLLKTRMFFTKASVKFNLVLKPFMSILFCLEHFLPLWNHCSWMHRCWHT